MTNDSNKPERPSRRDFTRRVAAALAAVPLASALGQTKRRKKPPARPRKRQLWEDESQRAHTEHSPPGVIGGGSFFLELQHKVTHKNLNGSAARPEVYTADEQASEYGDIAIVQVITEFEEYFSYWRYDFPKGHGPQLEIWFVEDPDTDIPAGTPSDILIKGHFLDPATSLLTFYLEMKEAKLGDPKPIKKKRRAYKHEHKDNASKVLRIGKWQLGPFDDTAKTSGATGYKFMVSFYEP